MRHFTTLNGQTLGTLFCGDNGRTLMQTKTEEQLMWTLSESTKCFEDNGSEFDLDQLMDLFLNESKRCTKSELLRRGWEESRWNEGLSHRLCLSDSGKTFLTR